LFAHPLTTQKLVREGGGGSDVVICRDRKNGGGVVVRVGRESDIIYSRAISFTSKNKILIGNLLIIIKHINCTAFMQTP